MLLGFLSFLLVVFEDRIVSICIPESVASTWNPCDPSYVSKGAEGYVEKCAKKVSTIHTNTHIYVYTFPDLFFFFNFNSNELTLTA